MRTRLTLELAATLASLLACHAPVVPASNGAVSTVAGAARAVGTGAGDQAAAPEAIRVAITFDDLPAHGPLLPNQTLVDVHRQILGELGAHRVPAVYGFVNGYRLEQHAEGRRVLELWRDAGHPLGNHSWGHEDVGEVGVEAFVRSIDRNDGLLAELVGDSDAARQARRVFRYPYLRQGRDPSWTLNYGDLTDGRRGAMFTYLPGNQALLSAFYEDRTSFDATTDPWSYVGSLNWRIWSAELGSMTAAPVEGIDFNGGAYTPVQFDGRLFVMVPGGEAEGYATQLYELVDGQAKPYVKLPGWSYQFVKLR